MQPSNTEHGKSKLGSWNATDKTLNTKYTGIVLWRAFAWTSQSTTLYEGPSQNADENNLMQKDEREYHPFYMGKK